MGVDVRERAEADKRAREVDEQVVDAAEDEDATATEERRKFRAV
jgi:signal transduction histidine kinase